LIAPNFRTIRFLIWRGKWQEKRTSSMLFKRRWTKSRQISLITKKEIIIMILTWSKTWSQKRIPHWIWICIKKKIVIWKSC